MSASSIDASDFRLAEVLPLPGAGASEEELVSRESFIRENGMAFIHRALVSLTTVLIHH